MTEYWPEAITYDENEYGPNGYDKMFTASFCNTLEEAKKCIRIWEEHYHQRVILSRIARYSEAGTEYIRDKLNMGLVKDLWKDFGDVPMDPDTECIEETWGFFHKGTHREEIWHWFEETFEVSVGGELMGHENELFWHGNRFEIVDSVPAGYEIWAIGINMCEGFLPLCRLKPEDKQPFEGAREIEPDTLKAIRTDGAIAILRIAVTGLETAKEMEDYLQNIDNREWVDPEWKAEMKRRIEIALPYARKIKWEGRE